MTFVSLENLRGQPKVTRDDGFTCTIRGNLNALPVSMYIARACNDRLAIMNITNILLKIKPPSALKLCT